MNRKIAGQFQKFISQSRHRLSAKYNILLAHNLSILLASAILMPLTITSGSVAAADSLNHCSGQHASTGKYMPANGTFSAPTSADLLELIISASNQRLEFPQGRYDLEYLKRELHATQVSEYISDKWVDVDLIYPVLRDAYHDPLAKVAPAYSIRVRVARSSDRDEIAFMRLDLSQDPVGIKYGEFVKIAGDAWEAVAPSVLPLDGKQQAYRSVFRALDECGRAGRVGADFDNYSGNLLFVNITF